MQFVRSMCLSVGLSVHPSVWLAAISTLTIRFNLYKKVIKCEWKVKFFIHMTVSFFSKYIYKKEQCKLYKYLILNLRIKIKYLMIYLDLILILLLIFDNDFFVWQLLDWICQIDTQAQSPMKIYQHLYQNCYWNRYPNSSKFLNYFRYHLYWPWISKGRIFDCPILRAGSWGHI